MKRKEVEDVMGGKAAWDNVDKTDGMAFYQASILGFERDGKRPDNPGTLDLHFIDPWTVSASSTDCRK